MVLRPPSAIPGRRLGACLCALAVLLLAPSTAAAQRDELVVDRESLGGTCSNDRPVRTISQALPLCSLEAAARIAPPGATVLVRRGSYPRFEVPRAFDGPDGVTFRAARGERPTVDGLLAEDTGNFRFEGFRITGEVFLIRARGAQIVDNDISPRGVSVRGGSADVLIEGNRIHDLHYLLGHLNGGYGVLLMGSGGGIRDATVRNNHFSGIPVDGIQATSVQNLLIEGNEITRVQKPPGTDAHSDPIQLLGGTDIVIRSNFIHDTARGMFNTDVMVRRLTLVNNLFVRIDKGFGTLLNEVTGAKIINNTYWDTRYGLMLADNATQVIMANNIIDLFASARRRLSFEDHNLIAKGDSYGANNSARAPRFVDPAGLDFRLKRGSPGIDAGIHLDAPALDAFGRTRLGRPDLGAVEYRGGRGFGLKLRGRQAQRFRVRRGLLVRLSSPVSCTVRATARVRLGKKRVTLLKPRRVRLAAGERARVVLRPKGRRATAALRRALKQRRAVRVSVRAVGSDRAGDSQAIGRVMRLRR